MPACCCMPAVEALHWPTVRRLPDERSRKAPVQRNWNRSRGFRWQPSRTFESIRRAPLMKHLRRLEDQSVYILREAYKHFDNLAMLWSMGKDSTVLLWLAREAFVADVPFPLLHVDTSYKIPAMIEYRDRLAREWHLNLVVGQNKEALAAGMNHTLGRVTCCTALKTNGLKQLLEQKGYTGVILGVRADEEGTRAKERYFSPRDQPGEL